MDPRFLQIHWLTSYPPTLLNRDEAGLGKRIPFGGVMRGRVSSQSLKRHWRLAGADTAEAAAANPWSLQALDVAMGVRTKKAVERVVMPRAHELAPAKPDEASTAAVTEAMLKAVYGDKAADPRSRQALYLGETELDYLAEIAAKAMAETDARGAAKAVADALAPGSDAHRNLRALKHGAGLGAALFGRMVTSDRSANVSAPVHVAHTLTVHAVEPELDYMTVVEDLAEDDETASAGIFEAELSAPVHYGYTVLDLRLLRANLAGDATLAGKVAQHLVHLVAEVSPGAKKGSTAPYAWAHWMLLEAGARQPRTLSNAFLDPVTAANGISVADAAVARIATHLDQLISAYNDAKGTERRQLALSDAGSVPDVTRTNLDALADWAREITEQAVPASTGS